ncbi:MAG: hypothetical protein IT299_00445 [Dehalococcoidia bacterium]|nr:hypothetical protein [Dehalococcoidia bacterium]
MMTSPYVSEVRLMLRAALVLFVFTVVVGILNGIDLVEFERKALLTHVHAGTLGWITIGVLAASYWLFGLGAPANRYVGILAYAVPLAITAYSLAFLTTLGIARPILGIVTGVVILASFLWALGQAPGRVLSVPHVGMLAALTMSVVGAVLGVLLGYMLATPETGLPQTLSAAHPASMVVGFLVPVGMALIEWALDGDSIHHRASIAGWLQIGLPFLGGILAVIGLLQNIAPLLMVGVPLEVVGLVILIVRLRGGLARAASQLMTPGTARHGLMALLFLIVNIALLFYLVSTYFSKNLEPPTRMLLALDHSIFIGVMTNGILALIARFRAPVSAVGEQIVFWGLNVGTAGFVLGLVLDTRVLLHAFTPILGLALLHGIATSFLALGREGAQTPA